MKNIYDSLPAEIFAEFMLPLFAESPVWLFAVDEIHKFFIK